MKLHDNAKDDQILAHDKREIIRNFIVKHFKEISKSINIVLNQIHFIKIKLKVN